jgi:putative ABC transport system permease protein
MPVGRVQTMEEIARAALARERFTLLLLGTFAALAVGLAAVGVYGVIAQSVSARVREIGVRMALGAGRGPVVAGVLGEGLALAAWGVAIGLVGGLALSWSVRAMLFGVSPLDPVAIVATPPLMLLVVALASLVPAGRAARLDPRDALVER